MFIETFETKSKFEYGVIRYVIMVGLMVIIYGISVKFADNIVLKEILVLGCTTLFMRIIFQQKIFKIGILVLLYQGLGLVIDYTSIILVSKCFPSITLERLSNPLINILLGALSQTVLFCFIMFITRYVVRKSSEILTAIEWVRFAIFPIFTIIVLLTLLAGFKIPQSDSQKNILICVAFGLIIMNILVFYLINDIVKRETKIRENEIILERVKNETKNYDKQRKREHEFKNHIDFITALVHENKLEEVKNYLKGYNQEMLVNIDLIDTNNATVNSIINSKYLETREKGIAFVVKVNDLSELKIKDVDIVLILSNMLNNAIEACEKCTNGVIRLKFMMEQCQTIISVVNNMVDEPIATDNTFLTSKTEDVELHGIGIVNIKETVERYGGSCVIKYDDNTFRFVIFIPE
jgi:sensor histidine kinase YesM